METVELICDSGSEATFSPDAEVSDEPVLEASKSPNDEAGVSPIGADQTEIKVSPTLGTSNTTAEKTMFLEVMAGSARLTAACITVGFEGLAIDHKGNKDKPIAPCRWMDLATPSGQLQLKTMIKRDAKKIAHVHLAPPCGTASRARDKRLKKADGSPADIDPKPLRSDLYPDGLPGLTGINHERVQAANILYQFTADLVELLEALGISWTLENPTNSLMWDTTPFRLLSRKKANQLGVSYKRVTFDSCMHGGARPKKTTFLVSSKLDFSDLEAVCDHDESKHKPWGLTSAKGCVFATAEERNYPLALCRKIALRLAKKYNVQGPPKSDQSQKVSAQAQPRRRGPMVVSEYKEILRFDRLKAEQVEDLKALLSSKMTPKTWQGVNLPEGSKVHKVLEVGNSGLCTVEVGIGWSVSEFTNASTKVMHPYDVPVVVPKVVAKALWQSAVQGPEATIRKRQEVVERYREISRNLQANEQQVHSKLHPDVEAVVQEKKILIFKRLLRDCHFDDPGVADLLVTGVKLIGQLSPLPFWRNDPTKAARLSPEMLWSKAKEAQADVKARAGQVDVVLAKKLMDITLQEVEEGGLTGPHSAEELTAQLGPLWIAAWRFLVTQNDKDRAIDDFSQYDVNATFGSGQKVSLKGLDHVVVWARARLQAVDDDGWFYLEDEEGGVWQGWLHHSWTLQQWRSVVGRVADLKSAYKQVPAHPAHAAVSVVAVGNEHGVTSFFRARSLMFGITAAVYAFLRISRAFAFIAASIFGLTVVEFFDDFTQLEALPLAQSAQDTLEALFDMTGWKVAGKEKRLPFSQLFVSLGVEVDLSMASVRQVLLRNKPGRVAAIKASSDNLHLANAKLGFKDALSLRGKISFAEGQSHARLTAPLARQLSEWASIKLPRSPTPELLFALSVSIKHLESAGPRVVAQSEAVAPYLVFVDGAVEEETSIGAVLISPSGEVEVLGAVVPDEVTATWKSKANQRQVIGQAEIFPFIVARLTWQHLLAHKRVIYFGDNEAARIGMIRAYSPVLASLKLVMQCVGWDYANESTPWYARVPTCANVADAPSRMEVSPFLKSWGAKVVAPVFPEGSRPLKVLKNGE